MTVKVKLTKEEYGSANLAVLFSKVFFKLIPVVYLVVTLTNIAVSPNPARSILPLLIPFVIFISLAYLFFRLSLNRAYKSSPRISETVEYQFGHSGIVITGESFMSSFNWEKMHKVTKTKKWLLLWHSNYSANVIPLNRLTNGMLEELKSIAVSHNVKNNL
jgi:hypothetical protein